jgi:hypothetical protein
LINVPLAVPPAIESIPTGSKLEALARPVTDRFETNEARTTVGTRSMISSDSALVSGINKNRIKPLASCKKSRFIPFVLDKFESPDSTPNWLSNETLVDGSVRNIRNKWIE